MMKQIAVLVLCSFGATLAKEILFANCTEGGHATTVELSPCESLPCDFKKGTTVDVKISFTAANDTATLKSKVYGIVGGVPVAFPLPNPDACKDSNITCPVKAEQQYTYNSSFSVLKSYPVIKLIVRWKLSGDSGDEVCFNFPMSISE